MEQIRHTVHPIEPYTDEELRKLHYAFISSKSYAANTAADFHRIRDMTILDLTTMLGLRPGEALNLKWENIDWENNEINLNPYTNKQRNAWPVILNEKAKYVLRAWKEIFDEYVHCVWVFPSLLTFEPITTSAFGKRLLQISKEAGVHKVLWYTEAGQPISNKSAYSGRRYFGTRVYHETKDPILTMRALRQTKMSSVQPYVWLDKDGVKTELDNIFRN